MNKVIEQAVGQVNRETEYEKVRHAQNLIANIQRARNEISELNETIAKCKDELKKIEHTPITAEQIMGG